MSDPAATSTATGSPSATSASGPPVAASGAACRNTVPKLVPLIRASVTRTMSVTPSATSLAGIGIMPHSGIPGTPTGPQPASTRTLSGVTSSAGSSTRRRISW